MTPVFSDADRRFFDENGYVVARGLVEPERCQAVIDAVFDFLGFDPNDPDDWYRLPLTRGGMLEMYQHQALWDNRQHPRVHQAFAELLGTEKLWVSFDRANFNPPVRDDQPEYAHGGMIHWDIDPATAHSAPFGLQGVLYLADTPAKIGGFCCVPGHHKLIERWAATGAAIPGAPVPGRRSPADRDEVTVVPIVGAAGDLVIWNNRLLHGNGKNESDRPRMAQYIMMRPAAPDDVAMREDRIRRWRDRLPPDADWAPGDPRHWEERQGTTATLTPLGRKLLGLDGW
jgi:hypothetical protein